MPFKPDKSPSDFIFYSFYHSFGYIWRRRTRDFSGQIEPCLGLLTGLGTVAKAPELFDIFDTNIYLAISAR
jgi:hypothetical protein